MLCADRGGVARALETPRMTVNFATGECGGPSWWRQYLLSSAQPDLVPRLGSCNSQAELIHLIQSNTLHYVVRWLDDRTY